MALTAAQRKANDKYIREHYKQVKLSMPNDEADALDLFCQERGYTKAGFIRRAIVEAMERDAQPVGVGVADLVGQPVGGAVGDIAPSRGGG